MHRNTFTFFALFFLLYTSAFDCNAQKLQIKSISNQQFTPNHKNELVLTATSKKLFTDFNKLELLEEYIIDKKHHPQLNRQQRYNYDEKGRHHGTLNYNGAGVLQSETKIHWDHHSNQNKVEQISYKDGKLASTVVTYLLEYDADDNKSKEKYFTGDGTLFKERTWFYDKEKELIKSFTWVQENKEPKKETTTTYKRNANGDLKESVAIEVVNGKEIKKDILFFSDNYVVEWETYVDGLLESHFINEHKDSVIIRTTRENKRQVLTLEEAAKEKEMIEQRISKNKELKTKKESSAPADVFATDTKYDSYGNIASVTQSLNGKPVFVTEYVYDDYGNITKTIKSDKEKNEVEEESLEYEEWGNVSKRTIKKNGKTVSEDHYTYEYYPKD